LQGANDGCVLVVSAEKLIEHAGGFAAGFEFFDGGFAGERAESGSSTTSSTQIAVSLAEGLGRLRAAICRP
jgi:hypothetical protein